MLRITAITEDPAPPRLVLEGRLIGPLVAELQAAVERLQSSEHALHLDLAHVQFVDEQGLALLHRLQGQGVILQAISPFLQELMHARSA